jgi:hypothetical protein
VYRARHVIIVSYVLSDLTTATQFSILKSNLILNFGPSISKDHRLYHKIHVDCGSLNALDGKFLISGTASTYLLKTYELILNFLLSQHKTNLNHDVFGMNTFLIVIGVMYCLHIAAVYLRWSFKSVYHS